PAEPSPYTVRSRDGTRQVAYFPSNMRGRSDEGPARPEVSVRDAGGKEILSFQEHKVPLLRVNVTADGRYVHSEDGDGVVKVWEAATGKVRLGLRWDNPPRSRHPRGDPRDSTPFSADGRRLALPVPGGGVRVWDLDTFRVVFACDSADPTPEVSPDGRK